eukprot:scaffold183_cov249-Pinguiococcus_pyrenoidosus.AAC.25
MSIYRKALAVNPSAAEVDYALKTLSPSGVPASNLKRAPPAYVSYIFDLAGRRKSFLENPNPAAAGAAAGTGAASEAPGAAGTSAVEDGTGTAAGATAKGKSRPPLSIQEAVDHAAAAADKFDLAFGLAFQNVSVQIRDCVEDALQMKAADGWHWLDVLDLGCGSGQIGQAFRGLSNRVIGVDLSKVGRTATHSGH